MIERVLTQFQAIPRDDLEYLLEKLDYYSKLSREEEVDSDASGIKRRSGASA
jgi:hypothetical protein